MTRTVVIVSLVLVAACDVGSIQQGSTDGNGSGSSDGSNGVICENVSPSPPGGHHNAGMSCIAAGCHLAGNLGAGAPAYSYAGTVYKDTAGTQIYAGATIFVTLGGTEKKTISADNGNFWFVPGVGGLDPPSAAMQGETKASACPTTTPMTGKLVQGGGNCNNCHKNGGTTSPIFINP